MMVNSNGTCPDCGRDFKDEPDLTGQLCPSDDCPSHDRYRCPKCGDTEHLYVTIVTLGLLIQDGENLETEDVGDHNWEWESPMSCDCGWMGIVRDAYRGNQQ